jgi:hypothetical protein
MELSISTILISVFFLVLLGFLFGLAYYSWERHYKFKRRSSSECEVGLRFSLETPPTFFGLQDVSVLLRKGQRIVAVKEGAVLARKTGEENENVQMQLSGFSVKIEFAES